MEAKSPQTSPAKSAQFGVFEADLVTEELRKSGTRIKIQNQPFKVLSCLLERPGQVVSREELQQRLWGNQTTVDFDHSLGTAINKLREALGDAADNPRFIETVARKGYRFIAPVSLGIGNTTAAVPLPATPVLQPTSPGKRHPIHLQLPWIVAIISIVFAIFIGTWAWLASSEIHTPLRVSQITYSGRVFPGEPLQEDLAATATDGSRIYFQQLEDGRAVLAQALIADGETSALPVPSEISAPSLGNISPDGSRLLVRNYLIPKAEQPLWIVPTLGGTARIFSNILAHDATWMPDGKRILYAAGTNLYIAKDDGTQSVKFADLPGRAFWLRWSPDGAKLRFTLLDSLNHTTSLWEISSNGHDLHPVLSKWSVPASECCGSWTPDGKYFVFQSAHSGMPNIWAQEEMSSLLLPPSLPEQITNGPLSYRAPITANIGHRIFFIGLDTRSVLLKYDSPSQRYIPYGKTLNAAWLVDFSRDGNSIAWINPEDSSLWSSHVDGTQRLQLTAPPMEVFMMHWSPDGQHIAFMGREPGQVWRIYIVDATGGNLSSVLEEKRNEADPDWSPDGNSLVFGRLPDLMAERSLTKAIYILNLKTRKVTTLPNSEGLFSPRWSPDGKSIVAMPLDQSKLMIYDTQTQTWKMLIARAAHDPVWSNDSRWIYFDNFLAEGQPVYRVSVPDGKLDRIAGLQSVQPLGALDFRFAGLTPGNIPLVSARISTANVYSANLDQR